MVTHLTDIILNLSESEEKVKSEAEEKARIFYRSCMDKNKIIEKKGAKPLLPLLKVSSQSLLSFQQPPSFLYSLKAIVTDDRGYGDVIKSLDEHH